MNINHEHLVLQCHEAGSSVHLVAGGVQPHTRPLLHHQCSGPSHLRTPKHTCSDGGSRYINTTRYYPHTHVNLSQSSLTSINLLSRLPFFFTVTIFLTPFTVMVFFPSWTFLSLKLNETSKVVVKIQKRREIYFETISKTELNLLYTLTHHEKEGEGDGQIVNTRERGELKCWLTYWDCHQGGGALSGGRVKWSRNLKH